MTPVNTVTPQPAGQLATCPLCHTLDFATTNDSVAAGGRWRCKRCGQMWTADRLAAIAEHGQDR